MTSVNDLLRVITALEPHRFDADEIEANSPVLPVFEVPAVRLARQFTTQQIDALLTLRKWGEIGTETQSLGSILYESTPVPADVHTAVATILGAVIEPSPDRVLTLRSQAIELMAHLDERQALILRHRWIEEEGKTLEELGEILSVTRERVRQLETKGFDKISEQINTSLFDELRWAAWKVSNGLGTKAPAESQVTRDLVRSLCGLDLEDPAFEVIRLINRMQIKGGWFVTGSAPDVMAAFAHSAPAGFATLEEFDQILWTLGIERRFRDEILASEERLLVRLGHVIRRYLAV
ncbi:MAG: hypothetical protein EBX39_14390, partial [Actinobacteria bacterium]|nr:hypothetical protein [Actinomycetota bacterium]